MTSKMIEEQAAKLLEVGELAGLTDLLNKVRVKTKKLVMLEHMIDIFNEEVKHNTVYTVFDYSLNLDEVVNHYMATKLLLRRFDFDLPGEAKEEFYYYCKANNVSDYFIKHLIENNIYNSEKVSSEVKVLFSEKEGLAYE